MSEPSNFERLHEHLRQIKQELGIDMHHPHGVSIHGKMYPANNKHLDFSETNYPNFGNAGFNIPFENGHRLFTWIHGISNPKRKWTALFTLQYPHIWTDLPETMGDRRFDEGKGYSYYPKVPDEAPEDEFLIDSVNPKNPEEFSDFIKKVSTAPRKGFKRSWSISQTYKDFYNNPDSMMDDDDFIEFQKHADLGGGLGSKNADPSHLIKARIHNAKYRGDNFKPHTYNIKTEQLRKNEEK